MRVLKPFLIIAIVLAIFEPGALSAIGSTASRAVTGFARAAHADSATPPREQQTYDRLCPLIDSYARMDATGRAAAARGIRTMARTEATRTQDPALRAVLHVVPQALGEGTTVQSKAARALVNRECRAHRN